MANEFKIKNGYLSEGNSQITGSLNVSGGITGSLFGTSSYATTTISASYAVTASYVTGSIFTNGNRALSSSYAVTASYATNALSASYAPGGASTPPFPYTGSATISGSLIVNDNAITSSLNTSTRTLKDANSTDSIKWNSRTLIDSVGNRAVEWENSTLNRNSIASLDWGNRITYDTSTSSSIKWEARELWDADPDENGFNTGSLDWNNRIAKDPNGYESIDWASRAAYDRFTSQSIDWNVRQLLTPNSTVALNWADDTYLDSNVYQRDYKLTAIQNAVSNNYNNPAVSYLGDVIEVDGSTTFINFAVTEGMLVYLDTGTWYPVDQATPGATKLLGIAHNVGSVGIGTGWILLEGHVVIDDTSTGGPHVTSADYGLPIYIEDSTTTGTMSTVVPTTTGGPNIVRILGHCYQQNGGTTSQWMMKFRPSNDWIEI